MSVLLILLVIPFTFVVTRYVDRRLSATHPLPKSYRSTLPERVMFGEDQNV